MIRQAVREAAILLIAAIGIALAVYAVRPDKIGSKPFTAERGMAPQSTATSGYSEISLDVAMRLYHENQAIFADARHAADYEAGHIKGALHLFPADQDAWLPDLVSTTDTRIAIVSYCDGEDCHLATELAELLYLNGFENVYYLKNGWTQWRENGLPVE
jgi:rhodanese-related sulfurtransferase